MSGKGARPTPPSGSNYKGKNYDPNYVDPRQGARPKTNNTQQKVKNKTDKKPKDKKPKVNKDTSGGETYAGVSLLKIVHGSADDFTTDYSMSVNPSIIAAQSGDPILLAKVNSYTAFRVNKFAVELRPVVSSTAAAGTTGLVGVWAPVDNPQGPSDANSALKCSHKNATVGNNATHSCAFPRDTFVMQTEATGAPKTWNPGQIFVSLIGRTVAVYQNGTPNGNPNWNGPLWQCYVHYEYRFLSASPGQMKGNLVHAPLPNQKVVIKEVLGEPLTLEVTDDLTLRALLRGKGRKGFWKFVSGVLSGLSGVVPPPWGYLFTAGNILVRAATGSTRTKAALEVFETYSDVGQNEPILGKQTRNWEMTLNNGSYQQMTDPEATAEGEGILPPPTGGPSFKLTHTVPDVDVYFSGFASFDDDENWSPLSGYSYNYRTANRGYFFDFVNDTATLVDAVQLQLAYHGELQRKDNTAVIWFELNDHHNPRATPLVEFVNQTTNFHTTDNRTKGTLAVAVPSTWTNSPLPVPGNGLRFWDLNDRGAQVQAYGILINESNSVEYIRTATASGTTARQLLTGGVVQRRWDPDMRPQESSIVPTGVNNPSSNALELVSLRSQLRVLEQQLEAYRMGEGYAESNFEPPGPEDTDLANDYLSTDEDEEDYTLTHL